MARKRRKRPQQKPSVQSTTGTGNVAKRKRPPKRRRRGRKTLHYLLLTIVVLVVGVVLSLTVFFKIKDINVRGSEDYPAKEIIKATGIKKGDNLFLTSTKEIPDILVTDFPYIESVKVRRVLPSTIDIKLTPSKPFAALQLGEEDFILINNQGKVLERGLVIMPYDVILVKGIAGIEKQPGETLGDYELLEVSDDDTDEEKERKNEVNQALKEQSVKELESVKVITYVTQALEKTGFQNMTNLDMTDPLNMTIMFENRLLLRLGTEILLDFKFRMLETAISLLPADAQGTISVENANEDGRAYYRPAEDKEEIVLYNEPEDKVLEEDESTQQPAEQQPEKSDAG